MDIFGGDIKQLQADLQADMPNLEAAEARVIATGIVSLDAMLRGLIEGYTITITVKAQKNS